MTAPVLEYPRPPEMNLKAFVQKLYLGNLYGQFEDYYNERHKEDPASWPLDLTPGEWLDAFSEFVLEHEL